MNKVTQIQERNYADFADYLESQCVQCVEGSIGRLINLNEIINKLLSHNEAKDLINDENLNMLANILPFMAYNYMNKEGLDDLYGNEISIYATNLDSKIVKWCLNITSIDCYGFSKGYKVTDCTNGHIFKFGD